ncbi:ATP-binding protein [Lysobacter sp. FW306-1B-D06B]|uniref:PAS domain-containing sensor histidine kinase n=1 Tax=Lysobacter sp. FW306-1B-D06B TaxID=3140250 RepID=UPI003140320A
MAVGGPSLRGLDDEARQLALLIGSVTDYAIYMLDPDGYIRSWNPGGERIKGYTDSEIVGQHFSRFYTPEDVVKGEPQRGLQCARTEGKFEAEGWRLRKDGTRFRASVVIDPIWHDGELIGFAKVTRDVTERYEAQLRLQDAQKALVQSQKLEAIGKLTLGLAHDFNNLLTVIVNSLDLINLQHAQDARTGEWVEAAQRAADRGALLTRQLLAFARAQNLAPEVHDVNHLLASSAELYRRACGPSIQCAFELGEDMPQLEVDATQFEAAVLNLVANSRDALPGGGTITVRTRKVRRAPPDTPDAEPRDYLAIEVIDNGEGMSADTVERAAEPFFTTKDIGRGSGLGLSQVYGFVAQSGGFVLLRSAPGQGTTVGMHLPARTECNDG